LEQYPDTEREFMRYMMLMIGVAFTLMVQRAMSIFLMGELGNWTRITCLSISAVFFAAHARSVSRLAIIYTRYQLTTWDDWMTFCDGTLGSIVSALCSHAFLIIIPCAYALEKEQTNVVAGISPGMCWGLIALDLTLLVAVTCVAVYAKRLRSAYQI
jgi:hypothetical protein